MFLGGGMGKILRTSLEKLIQESFFRKLVFWGALRKIFEDKIGI